MNKELRLKIVEMVYRGKQGHIPSAFSIVDMLAVLYDGVLKYDPKRPSWPERDYFILSKGHGCLALYAVLNKHGFVTDSDIELFCTRGGILGEHPDCLKVPGVEASTGSLGHGFPFAAGLALGLRIQKKSNRLVVLMGDGECHEGTVWEAAHVASNLQLGNLCILVDWNGSAQQLLPQDDLEAKWKAFGWRTVTIDGHDPAEVRKVLQEVPFSSAGEPTAILARTVKGKGVSMLEGHGVWHHRIPSEEEYQKIMTTLS